MSEKAKAEPKTYFLSKEELTALQNFALRRKNLELLVQIETNKVDQEQAAWHDAVSKRLGINLEQYEVSTVSGQLTEVVKSA